MATLLAVPDSDAAAAQARGIEADVVTCCSLINALERGGQWQLAEKLFQPFVRAQGATSQASGTGLGLSLSRALAERMGGKLTAKSDGDGKGSTFSLRLPCAPDGQRT